MFVYLGQFHQLKLHAKIGMQVVSGRCHSGAKLILIYAVVSVLLMVEVEQDYLHGYGIPAETPTTTQPPTIQ